MSASAYDAAMLGWERIEAAVETAGKSQTEPYESARAAGAHLLSNASGRAYRSRISSAIT
jgi:hypothetical protein